jgi:hypothetical protein
MQDNITPAQSNPDSMILEQSHLTDNNPWSNVQTKRISHLKITHNLSPTRVFEQFTPLSVLLKTDPRTTATVLIQEQTVKVSALIPQVQMAALNTLQLLRKINIIQALQ